MRLIIRITIDDAIHDFYRDINTIRKKPRR